MAHTPFFAYISQRRDWGRHTPLFLGRLRMSFFRGVARWLVALLPLSVCRLASRLPVLAFLLAFFARLPCRRVFVRPSCFRAILPRSRACFWRSRVWRCVVRFAVSILTPFFAVSRLVSARLVQSIKAIKKAPKKGNF